MWTGRRNKKAAPGHFGHGGFTLIEIMIVVCIIEIIIATAIPGLVRARESARSNSCSRNLRTIQGALQEYAIDKRLKAGASIGSWQTNLCGPAKYIRSTPACPSKGTYTVTKVDTDPTCNRTSANYPHTVLGH